MSSTLRVDSQETASEGAKARARLCHCELPLQQLC